MQFDSSKNIVSRNCVLSHRIAVAAMVWLLRCAGWINLDDNIDDSTVQAPASTVPTVTFLHACVHLKRLDASICINKTNRSKAEIVCHWSGSRPTTNWWSESFQITILLAESADSVLFRSFLSFRLVSFLSLPDIHAVVATPWSFSLQEAVGSRQSALVERCAVHVQALRLRSTLHCTVLTASSITVIAE